MMCQEPTVTDLMDDPLTAIVMASDGVSRELLINLLRWMAAYAMLRPAPERRDNDWTADLAA